MSILNANFIKSHDSQTSSITHNQEAEINENFVNEHDRLLFQFSKKFDDQDINVRILANDFK